LSEILGYQQQKCHYLKKVWPYGAPNIAWGLKFASLQNVCSSSKKLSWQSKSKKCHVLLRAVYNDNLNHVLMRDEGNFHLCGNVNCQKCPYWATKNHRDIH
jgi:hypothetical protein